MHRKAVIVLFFAYLAVTTTAHGKGPVKSLECLRCDSKDFRTCIEENKMETCLGNQRSCQTEVRYTGSDRTPIIKTGCKQGPACVKNNLQNIGAAWDPTQCNKGRRNSVCRCCCTGNRCNKEWNNLLCMPPRVRDKPEPPPDCGAHQETPKNGKKSCSKGTGPGSFCKFSCDQGYKMDGSPMSICEKNGDEYEWNKPPPLCSIGEICDPLPRTPDNGYKHCTGKGVIGSQCRFACETRYKRVGPEFVICEKAESGLEWSSPPPTCKIDIRCHPLPERPENGDYECTGTGQLGTKCEFTCNAGYDLIGQKHTVCVVGVSASKSVTSHLSRVHNMKAAWSNPTPTCKEVRCTLPKIPTNGHRECSGDGKLGTVCHFACHLGYRLKGFPSTTCKRDEQAGDARWTRKVPTCEPLCMTMPEKPEYGSKNCDGKGEIGTLCTFECFSGYELTGSETTSCELSRQGPTWTHETPICAPVCKPLPKAPQNGDKTCDGEGEIGTVCTYECDGGFRLKGQSESECEEVANGAEWSAQVPTCIPPPKCPPIGELANGEPNCNNDIHVLGTECNFQCVKGFNLVPTTKNPVVCLKNLTWSKKPCCIDCTKVKRDIMIAMDTSESMTKDGWNDMTRFVKNFISKFTYGPDATRFSIFSFGDGLYDKMRFDSAKTLKQLKKHVSRMKYKKGGTWTGKALKYANEEFEKDSNRKDAPDILLVLTDGKVKEANKQMMEEQAEILRDSKVEILALAIIPNRPSGKFNETEFYEQMKDMTGDREKVLKAGSTKEMSEEMDLLFSKACQDERLCKR